MKPHIVYTFNSIMIENIMALKLAVSGDINGVPAELPTPTHHWKKDCTWRRGKGPYRVPGKYQRSAQSLDMVLLESSPERKVPETWPIIKLWEFLVLGKGKWWRMLDTGPASSKEHCWGVGAGNMGGGVGNCCRVGDVTFGNMGVMEKKEVKWT